MKLMRALKVKNRMAGEVTTLESILQRENSRRSDNVSQINIEEIYKEYKNKKEELVKIKAAIAKANVNIYQKISMMAELKSQISMLNMLTTREGEDIVYVWGQEGQREQVKYNWTSFINDEKRDKLKIELQEKINSLQDEIDEYNAITDVEL